MLAARSELLAMAVVPRALSPRAVSTLFANIHYILHATICICIGEQRKRGGHLDTKHVYNHYIYGVFTIRCLFTYMVIRTTGNMRDKDTHRRWVIIIRLEILFFRVFNRGSDRHQQREPCEPETCLAMRRGARGTHVREHAPLLGSKLQIEPNPLQVWFRGKKSLYTYLCL
jgi:hypothetical protein